MYSVCVCGFRPTLRACARVCTRLAGLSPQPNYQSLATDESSKSSSSSLVHIIHQPHEARLAAGRCAVLVHGAFLMRNARARGDGHRICVCVRWPCRVRDGKLAFAHIVVCQLLRSTAAAVQKEAHNVDRKCLRTHRRHRRTPGVP